MRLPALKTRCHVEWADITGHINSPLSEVRPANCWNEGLLVKKTPHYLVLASAQYEGDNQDPVGDYCCIPLGVIKRIRRLK